jgi:hypothetical protein
MDRLACLIVAASALGAIPANAATYSAKLTAPPGTAQIIGRDISWTCNGSACRGATADSRPAVLCQGLARQVGALASFAADGRLFGAAELAKCNASAKARAGQASAAAAN